MPRARGSPAWRWRSASRGHRTLNNLPGRLGRQAFDVNTNVNSHDPLHAWANDLAHVRQDVEEAIKLFFIEEGMQRLARRDRVMLEALNHNARSWIAASFGMSVGVFMALRRIMDDAQDAATMARAIQFVVREPERFDEVLRASLLRRDQGKDCEKFACRRCASTCVSPPKFRLPAPRARSVMAGTEG
jgi:hypothetical protein